MKKAVFLLVILEGCILDNNLFEEKLACLPEISAIRIMGDGNTIRLSGNYLLVTEGFEGLSVIDVSDPASMKETAYLKFPDLHTRALAIDTLNHVAYIGAKYYIISVNFESSPYLTILDTFDLQIMSDSANVHYLAYKEPHLFAIINIHNNKSVIAMFNVEDPGNITLLDTVLLENRTYGTIQPYDNSNYLLVGFGSEIILFKVVGIALLRVKSLVIRGSERRMKLVGDSLLFIASSRGGLQIWRVIDSTDFVQITRIDNLAYFVDVSENLLFSADENVQVYDISSINDPVYIRYAKCGYYGIWDMVVGDDLLYLGCRDSIRVFQIRGGF